MRGSVLVDDEFLGKVAMVTGASSGIGEATVLELARRKAQVIMLMRSRQRGEEAQKRIQDAYPAADLRLEVADLSLVSSVVEFCNGFSDRVDILINNAGVFGSPYERTKEGIEMVLASNHLGHFVLTCLMLARGMLSPNARIILVTGAMYKRGNLAVKEWDNWTPESYHKMQAYSNSKLAVCLFALWLRSAVTRVLSSSAKVFAVHPGVVNTDISRHVLNDCLMPCRACLRCCMRVTMLTPKEGCQGILLCAADHYTKRRSGEYFNNRKLEAWHKPILSEDLILRCWDFSFALVQRTVRDPLVLGQLRTLRELPRDSLDDLAGSR